LLEPNGNAERRSAQKTRRSPQEIALPATPADRFPSDPAHQGGWLVLGQLFLQRLLANDPSVKEAAARAITDYGSGSGASRLLCGSLTPHHLLEDALSQFKRTDASLCFSSGYAAAIGTIDALLTKGDIIILDQLVHGCLIDAARLCRAKTRIFAHNDLNQLQNILKWAQKRHSWTPVGRHSRILIVTESVFSMDGDLAPLREIASLKEQHGAWLMLDEAHATGLYGLNRRGLAEAYGVAEQVDVHLGTLGKTLGSAGGYICGSKSLIQFLINQARTFLFSTAPTPASSAAATAALQIIQSQDGEQRRQQLWHNVDEIKNGLINSNWMLPPVRSAIIPVMVGDENQALRLADQLRRLGVYIPAIRYPTVARGTARLRLTVSASHNPVDIEALIAALVVCKSQETHGQEKSPL